MRINYWFIINLSFYFGDFSMALSRTILHMLASGEFIFIFCSQSGNQNSKTAVLACLKPIAGRLLEGFVLAYRRCQLACRWESCPKVRLSQHDKQSISFCDKRVSCFAPAKPAIANINSHEPVATANLPIIDNPTLAPLSWSWLNARYRTTLPTLAGHVV